MREVGAETDPEAGTGTEMHGVDVAGPTDAPAVVFVHGAVLTRKMWAPQRRALAGEFHVLAPDLPGHGARSDDRFRFEAAVELVDEVIERLTDGSVLLVGLSLGGYVSTAYASRHPENVDGLVIAGSSANPVDTLGSLFRGVAGATRLATRSGRVERGARRFSERWVRKRDLRPDDEAEIIGAGFYPRQFGEAGPQLAGRDFRSAFAAYPGPALVVNGEKDRLNRRGERNHADAASDARVEVLDGAGHTCNLYRPEAFTAAVRRFHGQTAAGRPEAGPG